MSSAFATHVMVGRRRVRRFIHHPKPVNDGTVRCFACGQIDEQGYHDDALCPITGRSVSDRYAVVSDPVNDWAWQVRAPEGFLVFTTETCGPQKLLEAQKTAAISNGELAKRNGEAAPQGVTFDLIQHLYRQREFSERTFGPGARTAGVIDHIRKELREIEDAPADISEWIDVVLLALDGAWRSGAAPEAIAAALLMKQARNEGRTWPDWRASDPNKAIEHDRSGEAPAAPQAAGVGEDELIERGLRTIRAYDAVRYLRDALSATTARLTGYDWNADPDGLTKRQGDAFAAADKVFADLGAAVASHPEIELPECQTCGGTGKIEEAARTEGANQHSACVRTCDDCDGCGFAPDDDEPAPLRAPSREPEGGAVDERLKWFLKVIEGAGGEVCSTESRHNPINVFCEDRDKGDDTFNISEAAGYTQTSHDTSFDTSTTRITDKGRAYLAALATREEAPAEEEIAEASGAANTMIEAMTLFADHGGNLITRGDARNMADHLRTLLSALRAQPPAREDAQPVMTVTLVDAGPALAIRKWDNHGLTPGTHALYTHPAPDALRVAVEALEPFAREADSWPELADDDTLALSAPDGTASAYDITMREIRLAASALAALQAEQKGGA